MAAETVTQTGTSEAALRAQIKLASGERLYGVVDAARDCALAFEAKNGYGKTIRSLFQGAAAPALAHVAPYLILIEPDGGYLQNWARRLGKSAGILLISSADEETLHKHLRNVFVVQDEGGQEFFFRFYDPRVLRTYLPTCTPDEVRSFFGPVRMIAADGSKPGTVSTFTFGPAGAMEATVVLPQVEPGQSVQT
jgi:hypothetical protein